MALQGRAIDDPESEGIPEHGPRRRGACLLSLSASSAVLATCETCNSQTAECVSGNDFWCIRTVELEFDEDGNLVSRKVTCESGGSCDWGAPEY